MQYKKTFCQIYIYYFFNKLFKYIFSINKLFKLLINIIYVSGFKTWARKRILNKNTVYNLNNLIIFNL